MDREESALCGTVPTPDPLPVDLRISLGRSRNQSDIYLLVDLYKISDIQR